MRRPSWLFLCLLGFSGYALAENLTAERVLQDLAARDGYVIKVVNEGQGEIYVDLGASQGIRVGDLLTVQGADEVVVHPVTGAEVMRMPSRLGVLGVTRSLRKYSVARILQGADIEVGNRVRRFSGLSSRFVDHTGAGVALYRSLRDGLPDLAWQGYFQNSDREFPRGTDELLFVLRGDQLSLSYGPSWPVTSFALSGVSLDRNDLPVLGGAGEVADNAGVTGGSVSSVNRGNANPPNRDAPRRVVAEPLAVLSTAALAADFVSYAGQQLLVSGSQDALVVSEVGAASVREITRLTIPSRNRLLGVGWWQPDEGPPLLAVTTWDGEEVEGMLLQLVGSELNILKLHLPYILGTFDLDGDGRREALLGQMFDRRGFFGRYLRQLTLHEGALQESKSELDLPANFSVLGSVVADLTGDGKLEVAMIRDRKLSVYDASGEKIYGYDHEVGAGLSMLTYDVSPDREFSPVERVFLDPAPLVLRGQDKGPAQLLLLRANYPMFSAPGIDLGAKESWLVSVAYQQDRFIQRSLTEVIDQPVAALTSEANRLVLLGSKPRMSSAGAEGVSSLLTISLPLL